MSSEEQEAGDAVLIARSAAGDRQAFDTIVERHAAAVFRFVRSLAGERAEDVLQETFLAAWRNCGSFRFESSARSWLFAIARHSAYRGQRRRSGEPSNFESLEMLAGKAGWADPESLAIDGERRELLARALASLPPADREILMLRDVEQLSGEEAVAILRIPLAAMKTRLHRARVRLVGAVRKECHDERA